MPRKLRMEYPGAIYHVVNRGDRREDIFKDDLDRKGFLSALEEACQKTEGGQWGDDALCAYEYLSTHCDVDTNNVYLLGVSAGVSAADQLLASRPDLWKGAYLFSVHAFPVFDRMRAHSIALDVGARDMDLSEYPRLLLSQEQLAAQGVSPILAFHPGAGHIVRTIALDKARMNQLAQFIYQP